MSAVKYGWYSDQQADITNVLAYRLAENGESVAVTHVTETADHGTGFTDMRFVGMVDEYVSELLPTPLCRREKIG